MALIEIIGDDNHVLINDSYANLVLAGSAKISFAKFDTSTSTLGGYSEYEFTIDPSSLPIIAIRSAFSVALNGTQVANGKIKWTFVCEPAGLGRQIDVFVFYLPSKVPNAGGMMQLFNAQGELVFDSNLKYAKVERQANFTFDSGASIPLQANRTYAVSPIVTAREYSDLPVDAGGPGGFRMNRIAKYVGVSVVGTSALATRFEYSNLSYRSSSPQGGYNLNQNGAMLVFDMTTLGV